MERLDWKKLEEFWFSHNALQLKGPLATVKKNNKNRFFFFRI